MKLRGRNTVGLLVVVGAGACGGGGDTPRPTPLDEAVTCVPIVISSRTERIELSTRDVAWRLGDEEDPVQPFQTVMGRLTPAGDLLLLTRLGRELWSVDGSTGAVRGRVGGSGRGPGEFGQAWWFDVSREGVVRVVDRRARRVLSFGPDREPRGTTTVDVPRGTVLRAVLEGGPAVLTTSPLPTSRPLGTSGGEGDVLVLSEALVTHRSGGPTDTLAVARRRQAWPAPGRPRVAPSQPSVEFDVRGDRIGFVSPDGRTATMVAHGSDRRCGRWEGGGRPGVGAFPDEEPPIQRIRLGRDGGLWLSIASPDLPPSSARPVWVRVGDGGAIDRIVALERHVSFMDVSEGAAVLWWYGDLGVEHVGMAVR